MTLIIGISGKKQSGKSTSGNFILSLCMVNLGIANNVSISDTGKINVSDLLKNTAYTGEYDYEKLCADTNDYILNKSKDILLSHVRIYNFADILKKDICMNILGLNQDQCYGSDDDKNSLTDIKWENMPKLGILEPENLEEKTGFMTAREVMQFIGTDIFRNIKTDIWCDATIRKIKKDNPKIAIITDCRFPNEVDAIRQNNGYVMRLTRSPFDSDHISETVLDKDNYDWFNFDIIIDNAELSIYDQCELIKKFLTDKVPSLS
jgi:hypothetical protein